MRWLFTKFWFTIPDSLTLNLVSSLGRHCTSLKAGIAEFNPEKDLLVKILIAFPPLTMYEKICLTKIKLKNFKMTRILILKVNKTFCF